MPWIKASRTLFDFSLLNLPFRCSKRVHEVRLIAGVVHVPSRIDEDVSFDRGTSHHQDEIAQRKPAAKSRRVDLLFHSAFPRSGSENACPRPQGNLVWRIITIRHQCCKSDFGPTFQAPRDRAVRGESPVSPCADQLQFAKVERWRILAPARQIADMLPRSAARRDVDYNSRRGDVELWPLLIKDPRRNVSMGVSGLR